MGLAIGLPMGVPKGALGFARGFARGHRSMGTAMGVPMGAQICTRTCTEASGCEHTGTPMGTSRHGDTYGGHCDLHEGVQGGTGRWA